MLFLSLVSMVLFDLIIFLVRSIARLPPTISKSPKKHCIYDGCADDTSSSDTPPQGFEKSKLATSTHQMVLFLKRAQRKSVMVLRNQSSP